MKRKTLGSAGWTPRERVRLWLLIAGAEAVADPLPLLASLRCVIIKEECQADRKEPGWVIPTE